jgi:hypothetical protein
MFKELFKIEYLDTVQEQVAKINWGPDNKRIVLNKSDGGLFTGAYTTLPEYENTPLGQFLNDLSWVAGDIGEARLLFLESGDSYTAHTDPDDRYHLVIKTNPYSYIMDIDEQRMIHLPADGTVWHMDTSKKHLAGNYGGTTRIHLNVRSKLPNYTGNGIHLKIEGGAVDWKQALYMDTMSYINQSVKLGLITGIEKVNDRELLLNTDHEVLENIKNIVLKNNFDVTIQRDLNNQ